MTYSEGYINAPDEDPYEKLKEYLILLWKLDYDPQDILDFTANTLEGLEKDVS